MNRFLEARSTVELLPTLAVVLLSAIGVSFPAPIWAQEHVWIIGGGPSPEASQAQIEFNVRWVLSALEELAPETEVRVYYANGQAPGVATHEWSPVSDEDVPLHPLARVFGQEEASGSTFRPHRVPEALGSTQAEELVPALEQQFASLQPGDRALLLYNGHGTWSRDHSQNALRLWGESRLTVREFERLLSNVDPAVPIRFIFTQCFSGAFERAIHPDAADVSELAEGRRCGFFAESEDRESEGCSPSIVIGDYRDYTTYFFAALTGRTRLGEPIEGDPDVNGNGVVTPFEAHLYVLSHGYNGDLPRSTSEVFLERWQPWYLRWVGTDDIPDNEYGQVTRTIARANNLPLEPAPLARAAESRYRELVDEISALHQEREEVRKREEGIQKVIREEVLLRWPGARYPHAPAYRGFLESGVENARRFIVEHPRYPDLVQAQERIAELELELMDLDRRVAQIEKLRRSRMLARALDQLERHGSEERLDAYWRLRRCEDLPVGGGD